MTGTDESDNLLDRDKHPPWQGERSDTCENGKRCEYRNDQDNRAHGPTDTTLTNQTLSSKRKTLKNRNANVVRFIALLGIVQFNVT